jgi:hypothetical protein
MSTTSLIAGDVMDRSAALLNDPAKTDYTYSAQLIYLNMAIDELVEGLEESNVSPTNSKSAIIQIPVGSSQITPTESAVLPHYPVDLVEIQEIGERLSGTTDSFVKMGRKEFLDILPAGNSLLFWVWEDQIIKFNQNGALTVRDVQIKYVKQGIAQAIDEHSVIGTINARSYLSYKTAAICAAFIAENETRAEVLNDQAEKAMERMTGISNKGRQQMATRHRPFRASYKSRGGY